MGAAQKKPSIPEGHVRLKPGKMITYRGKEYRGTAPEEAVPLDSRARADKSTPATGSGSSSQERGQGRSGGGNSG